MARAKIAPVLSALLEDLDDLAHGKKPHPKASREGDRRVLALARADLKALKAVVFLCRLYAGDPQYVGDTMGLPHHIFVERLERALSRLSPRPSARRTRT
jgi:hypothetical protein